jgi:hypothetical protein
VRKRMTSRCSKNILNGQTSRDVLKMSAEADVVGATKIFEKETGEEEIVYQRQSFIMISAHHRVRSRRGWELCDSPIFHNPFSNWFIASFKARTLRHPAKFLLFLSFSLCKYVACF